MPAHAVPGMAEQGRTGWRQSPASAVASRHPTPRSSGHPRAPGPTSCLHRQPPCAGELRFTTHPHSLCVKLQRGGGSVRTPPQLGADTQLSVFLCPGNRGCLSKSISINQLPAARTSELNSALVCEPPAASLQNPVCDLWAKLGNPGQAPHPASLPAIQ